MINNSQVIQRTWSSVTKEGDFFFYWC